MDIDARELGRWEILWIFEFFYYNQTLCLERNFPWVSCMLFNHDDSEFLNWLILGQGNISI